MTINQVQQDIENGFSMFDDWSERYEYLISLGQSIPKMNPKHKTDNNLIKGCQSRVWVYAEKKDGKLMFSADSDAIITKGIVAMFIKMFSEQTPKDIIDADMNFIDRIGLKDHLSPTRANGLVSMVKQIKLYAIAYRTQKNGQ